MPTTIAKVALKPRDFESYFIEYQLLTTEVEINAYWKRMDEIVAHMSEEEKNKFFKQLDVGLTAEVEDSKKERHRIASLLLKNKETEKLRKVLLK